MPNQTGFTLDINGKTYVNARASIISDPQEMPRELAFSLKGQRLNPNFMWISGRYVQGDKANENGQFWTSEDLKENEYSIRYTPLNVLHEYDKPVGVFVETKLVHREDENAEALNPEIQALSLLWAANFPAVAEAARAAHAKGKLWYSMECTGEAKQCLTCDEKFEWAASKYCSHLEASVRAPRRLINPTFHGGALIFPPSSPGWSEADVQEVAKATQEFADRTPGEQGSKDELKVQSLLHLLAQQT